MTETRMRLGLDRLTAIDSDRSPLAVLADVTKTVRSVVPYDGSYLSTTDPKTTLPSTASVVGLPARTCSSYWDSEYLIDDFGKFIDLHRQETGAVTLHRMTEGNPHRSHRHNEIYSAIGMDAELRSVFALGRSCWGVMNLVRARGEPDFSDSELAFVDAAAPIIASKLRRSSVARSEAEPLSYNAPGAVIFDAKGTVVSMTDTARDMFSLFPPASNLNVDGVLIPPEAYIVAARARAYANGRIGPEPISRASADGIRLTLRASSTHTPDGRLGETVLVVEPARSDELLPLIVEAFELSAREEQVVSRLLSGDSAQEIATNLFISVHTARDHIKSIYEKAGVKSRAELTRSLIDSHYLPRSAVVHD